MGKTFAVWVGPLLEALEEARGGEADRRTREEAPGLRALWITPLRALAADIHGALVAAAEGMGVPWRVELRTGDTGASVKKRQRARLPAALVTTPESLALLTTYPELRGQLAGVRAVVVDEWHELLGTKRGVQTELGLARVRALSPKVRTWGLSATLGNLEEAAETLVGVGGGAGGAGEAVLIRAESKKALDIRTIVPPDVERFPWAGHLGLRLLPQVLEALDGAATTLLFTNTRSQTEIWFGAILKARPEWIGKVGIHHGSLDRDLRGRVEDHLRAGTLRCVVCTSSLDLGVDFAPVEQVVQVGSPKGVARLLQRAGRSGHRPGAASRIVCVPTNALELIEFAAAQDAISAGALESRTPLTLPLDLLVQHLVGVALGEGERGFEPKEVLREVRTTRAFRGLTDEQWTWCMDFVARGGPALRAYPQYARLVEAAEGGGGGRGGGGEGGGARFKVASARIERLHRQAVGTITSDQAVVVRMGRGVSGRSLGTIEEGFIARLAPGDVFAFAGRRLRLLKVRGMTAHVEPATRSGRVPTWNGARMPLSSKLAAAVRGRLDEAADGRFRGPELEAVAPLLKLQGAWSRLPRPGELLIECVKTREGHHLMVYPFEGRLVHEGLAALVAFRLAREGPRSFSLASGDHGFELATPEPIEVSEAGWRAALSAEGLAEDLLSCLNAAELARRQFREVARVAGLVVPGFPGEQRSSRQLQASSELFYDVLTEFDPGNLLLDQARREVLERQLELTRLRGALERIAGQALVIERPRGLTPLGFPLWADSLREALTTEQWTDRVQRMLKRLEAEAGAGAGEAAEEEERAGEGRRVRKGRRRMG
jgi:ATP-dependent Lhr-like helicase